MPRKIYGPRKRRTREHVIADLAVHHVEGFILEAGHTAERVVRDYGYDLEVTTFDRRGYVEPDRVYFQIKGSEELKAAAGKFVYDIDIRDYNLWLHEQMLVILVLYDAARRIAFWQDIQRYFEIKGSQPQKGARWVRVQIPEHQVLDLEAIGEIRRRKNEMAI